MASNSEQPILPLYLLVDNSTSFDASIVSANPSQTALVLNCPPGTDGSDCGYYNLSITVGPWAAATPPPDLPATGTYVEAMTVASGSESDQDGNQGFSFDLTCLLTSRTIPALCTSTNIGGNNDGTPTVTITSPAASNPTEFALSLNNLRITAGADKLSAASTATGAHPSASGRAGMSGSSSAAAGSKASGSGVSATGSGAGASQTGAASQCGVNMGSWGLIALVIAFLTR